MRRLASGITTIEVRPKQSVRSVRRAILLMLALASILAFSVQASEEAIRQETFPSAEAAARSLGKAYQSGDRKAMARILGDNGFRLVSSGDPVTDRHEREWFVSLYDEGHEVVAEGESRATLEIGRDSQPYPIPLIREKTRWRFDRAEGHEELLSRRMSKNELSALNVVVALAEAQQSYFRSAHGPNGIREYAGRIGSTPGSHDGLVWKGADGKFRGPLAGIAEAAYQEGYRPPRNGAPVVYRGYCYRILTAQGAHAQGGARSYIENGRLTGGFALVAYPVRYGVSGILTYLVNQDGIVYQKDLGPETVTRGNAMKRFDPDVTWSGGM